MLSRDKSIRIFTVEKLSKRRQIEEEKSENVWANKAQSHQLSICSIYWFNFLSKRVLSSSRARWFFIHSRRSIGNVSKNYRWLYRFPFFFFSSLASWTMAKWEEEENGKRRGDSIKGVTSIDKRSSQVHLSKMKNLLRRQSFVVDFCLFFFFFFFSFSHHSRSSTTNMEWTSLEDEVSTLTCSVSFIKYRRREKTFSSHSTHQTLVHRKIWSPSISVTFISCWGILLENVIQLSIFFHSFFFLCLMSTCAALSRELRIFLYDSCFFLQYQSIRYH